MSEQNVVEDVGDGFEIRKKKKKSCQKSDSRGCHIKKKKPFYKRKKLIKVFAICKIMCYFVQEK